MRTYRHIAKIGLVAVLAAGIFIACQPAKQDNNANNTTAAASTGNTSTGALSGNCIIAYVDLDTVEMYYDYFKVKKAELEKKQQAIDNELKANARQLQNEYADFQRKANTMTQAEGEATQRQFMAKQQQLQEKQQSMSSEYAEQESKFNDDLQKRLNDFLANLNGDKRYAYILSYRNGASNILFKDPKYDITKEVIQGLNAAEKK